MGRANLRREISFEDDWIDVAIAVLSRKIKLSSGCHEKPEDVIKKIVMEILASEKETSSPKKL